MLLNRQRLNSRKLPLSRSIIIEDFNLQKKFHTVDFFKENVPKNRTSLNEFCEALKNGDAENVEKQLTEYLRRTISIRDTFVKKQMKENFHPKGAPSVFHGILLGILSFRDTWSVSSNRESGDEYSM